MEFAETKSKQRKVLSMIQSILHFIENDTKIFNKVIEELLEGKKDTADLSNTVVESCLKLAANLVGEIYEGIDAEIKDSIIRKQKYYVEKKDETKSILDVMGMVEFKRTGYVDKVTGEYVYLLDQVLGLDNHQRITMAAAAEILEETIESSYAKGGRALKNSVDNTSKQAVKRLVHDTIIEMPVKELEKKKKFKCLHIVADEDHVAAQFWNEKGDLKENSAGQKINTIMPKLICLYEDVIDEGKEDSGNHRYRLIGKHYFCGTYKGTKNNYKLWQEVNEYIEATYDTKVLERVYIAGDGASWIRAGCEVLENSRFVLDKYHMMKYINASTTHLLDSIEEVKEEIWESINSANKGRLRDIYGQILAVTEEGNKYEEVRGALRYLLNQWDGVKIRVEESQWSWKCCAEGQISHVLSSRMSSRPMGWSELGCDQMAKFRAYNYNGGKIIDLLRYQKEKQSQEEKRKEQEELIQELRKSQARGKYQEALQASIPGIEASMMRGVKRFVSQTYTA